MAIDNFDHLYKVKESAMMLILAMSPGVVFFALWLLVFASYGRFLSKMQSLSILAISLCVTNQILVGQTLSSTLYTMASSFADFIFGLINFCFFSIR